MGTDTLGDLLLVVLDGTTKDTKNTKWRSCFLNHGWTRNNTDGTGLLRGGRSFILAANQLAAWQEPRPSDDTTCHNVVSGDVLAAGCDFMPGGRRLMCSALRQCLVYAEAGICVSSCKSPSVLAVHPSSAEGMRMGFLYSDVSEADSES